MEILLIFLGIIFLITAYVWHKKNKEYAKEQVQTKGISKSEAFEVAKTQMSATTRIEKPIKPKVNREISFKVSGVTKVNEDGKDIQAILKKIANQYKREHELESFDGLTNKEIIDDYFDNIGEFEDQYIYNKVKFILEEQNKYDKDAIKVYLLDYNDSKYHVGYVKRDSNKALKYELIHNKLLKTETEFTGGKYKHIDYDDFNDKDIVTTKEITRGLSIKAVFENEIMY
ncbi:HIRAN domain-containing protein [Oceanobacillus sp. FSL K6-2867]|uniref:HIRAN domain-containing protein n=1 Tax=Oceanobacillus sp. FSL K6-2867 TaxID=2954748 RepID=UPI0030DCC10E